MKKIVTMFLALALMLSIVPATATTAFAADNTDPYVHYWYNTRNTDTKADDLIVITKNEYDIKGKYSTPSDYVTFDVNTNKLFDQTGRLLMIDVATCDVTDTRTVGFGQDGLYVIAKNGELRHMAHSTDNTYQVTTFKATKFTCDYDDMAVSVESDLSSKKLADLTFTGTYKRHTDPVVEKGSFVKMSDVEGDMTKVAYYAYANNKVFLTTYCRNSNVWQNDFSLLLTNKCRGAKFAGYAGDYSILLSTLSGSVYQFFYAEGFATPHLLTKDVKVFKFETTDKGFVSKIVTSAGDIAIDTTITVPGGTGTTPAQPSQPTNPGNGGTPTAKVVTNCKHFIGKSQAYNGSTLYGTLQVSGKVLNWKGAKVADCVPTDMGITTAGVPVWIYNKTAYAYSNGAVQKLSDNADYFTLDDGQCAIGIRLTTGKTLNF